MAGRRVPMVILKVASRCNLACTYCYVYTKGDDSWRTRPVIMSDETFTATLSWLRRQAEATDPAPVSMLFHGGEPMLVGPARFDRWARQAQEVFADLGGVGLFLQTNGVLIDDRWIDVFTRHRVGVGVSVDGPADFHDRTRIDHAGRGSHARVINGIERLKAAGLPFGLLCVIDFEQDPLTAHRHVMSLGGTDIGYLFPDHTHETIREVRARHGPTPVADWLIPVFDHWWANDSLRVRVRELDGIVASVLGRRSRTTFYGNSALGHLVVEADGTVEGLDVLRICEPGLATTGLTVHAPGLAIDGMPEFHRRAVFGGLDLPTACRPCPEARTCGGGWLPHRYSRERGFDNPSAWCADLLKLFDHVRGRLNRPTPASPSPSPRPPVPA